MFKRKAEKAGAAKHHGKEKDSNKSAAEPMAADTASGTVADTADQKVKIQELEEIAQRIQAEFSNYKKRVAAEQENFVRFASGQTLMMLLPDLNNIERAIGLIPDNLREDPWSNGVTQSYNALVETLRKLGLEKIATKDASYDPYLHEAVLQEPGPKDKILQELECGYTLHGKVVLPAKVKVGDGS